MITEKEKAEELIDKYLWLQRKLETLASFKYAQECAIINVKEIISACEYNHVESYNTEWWNRVIKEIESYEIL
jgi:hypothetical protein